MTGNGHSKMLKGTSKARNKRDPKAGLCACSGFTMVELLVVLAIVMVITTITIPTIEAMSSPKHELRKQARDIMGLMAQARTLAIKNKVQVDVRIDPSTREAKIIETRVFLAAQQEESSLLTASDATNEYEKVIVFDESITLDSFEPSTIVNDSDKSDPFTDNDSEVSPDDATDGEHVAVSFNHFGGSNGGGVSLAIEGLQINVAADILTGRPKVVKREEEK